LTVSDVVVHAADGADDDDVENSDDDYLPSQTNDTLDKR